MKVTLLLIVIWFFASVGCGDEPDFTSCYEGDCCYTECNYGGTRCETHCD